MAAIAVEGPHGKLTAQMMPAIKVDGFIQPKKVTKPKPGVFVFDFGQNFAGFAELNLPARLGFACAAPLPCFDTVNDWQRMA